MLFRSEHEHLERILEEQERRVNKVNARLDECAGEKTALQDQHASLRTDYAVTMANLKRVQGELEVLKSRPTMQGAIASLEGWMKDNSILHEGDMVDNEEHRQSVEWLGTLLAKTQESWETLQDRIHSQAWIPKANKHLKYIMEMLDGREDIKDIDFSAIQSRIDQKNIDACIKIMDHYKVILNFSLRQARDARMELENKYEEIGRAHV